MLRRARIALAFVALATLFNTSALFADGDPVPPGDDPDVQQGGNADNPPGDLLDWLAGIFGGGDSANDEFNPQHLPGG
jgi:hypothetical protein